MGVEKVRDGDIVGIVVTLCLTFMLYKLFRMSVKVVRHSEVMIVERFGSYLVSTSPPSLRCASRAWLPA
jgi:hypothetical protein